MFELADDGMLDLDLIGVPRDFRGSEEPRGLLHEGELLVGMISEQSGSLDRLKGGSHSRFVFGDGGRRALTPQEEGQGGLDFAGFRLKYIFDVCFRCLALIADSPK